MDNRNIYIGNRYVPIFADPIDWNNSREYEPLTIVLHNGYSYTSKKFVPLSIDIANTEYWALTGNYNAQVEQYRREVSDLADDLTEFEGDTADNFTNINTRITNVQTTLQNNIDALSNSVDSRLNTMNGRINTQDGKIATLESNMNGLQEDMSDVQTDFDNLESSVNTRINTVTNNLNSLTHNFNMFSNLGTVVCIGDSYLEGYNPSGYANGWGYYLAPLLGKTLNDTLKRFYKGGSGFNHSVDGINFNSLVNTAYNDIGAAGATNVGAVIFVGGANEPSAMGTSITTTLQNARSKFPNAKIMFAYGSNYKDQSCYNKLNVTTAYQEGGRDIPNCYYIGDLTMGLKANPSMYGVDDVHLTSAGYAYLAKMIANAMAGYRINFNRPHRAFENSFMEYISNDTYVFQLFATKAYTINVPNHISNGGELLYTISQDLYLTADEDLFFIVDTNGYIKTSDDKFHNASFVLRLYPNRIEVYDYAINDEGTNYVGGTITAFQLKPCMVTIPCSIM